MSEKFDEFLEEVENDIRQERLLNLWKKYRKFSAVALSGILFITAGIILWKNYDYNNKVRISEKFISARDLVDKKELTQALALFEQIEKSSNKTYQLLALFQKAAILSELGQPENIKKTVTVYQEIAANSKVEKIYRDFATLLEIILEADQGNASLTDLITKVTPLTEQSNPWYPMAIELKAILYEKMGNISEAISLFALIVRDPKTPEGIAMRSQLMTQLLSSQLPDISVPEKVS